MFVEVLAVTSSGAEYNEKVRNWGLAAVVMIGGGYYGETAAAGSDAYWVCLLYTSPSPRDRG